MASPRYADKPVAPAEAACNSEAFFAAKRCERERQSAVAQLEQMVSAEVQERFEERLEARARLEARSESLEGYLSKVEEMLMELEAMCDSDSDM